ncbi:MarR family winged helix-turn-helix transcriptional regulator [uncultured Williamsia sp.]|uniref:MarR family winged helix-turn-helix transcriptional regulator n=1 Tax=uncultured Williamsia sp. TaxID=259311 RepID=UPI002637949C|nr:MarR family winged helix-turn-helix transcriptional regulator [uncultured Williamsia sp.]
MTDDSATRSWALLYDFVEAQGRRAELAQALGFSLGGGRGKVLTRLGEGPRTLRDIAADIGVDAPYATVIVDKLESHGLVDRRPHPDDRRRKLVALTEAGRDALTTVEAILRRPPAAMDRLSETQRQTLLELLTELTADGV